MRGRRSPRFAGTFKGGDIMHTVEPTQLKRLDDGALVISWSNGEVRKYTVQELRSRCPCATCRQQSASAAEEMFPVLSEGGQEKLQIAGMTPMGNYAYTIEFSDGHNTGIYALTLLRSLGELT